MLQAGAAASSAASTSAAAAAAAAVDVAHDRRLLIGMPDDLMMRESKGGQKRAFDRDRIG